MTKADDQLKRDIEAELSWDPKVNAAEIEVSVNEGAVSLLGTVDTYAQKWAAEDATKREPAFARWPKTSRSRFRTSTSAPR